VFYLFFFLFILRNDDYVCKQICWLPSFENIIASPMNRGNQGANIIIRMVFFLVILDCHVSSLNTFSTYLKPYTIERIVFFFHVNLISRCSYIIWYLNMITLVTFFEHVFLSSVQFSSDDSYHMAFWPTEFLFHGKQHYTLMIFDTHKNTPIVDVNNSWTTLALQVSAGWRFNDARSTLALLWVLECSSNTHRNKTIPS
jgi:hypothetical protein